LKKVQKKDDIIMEMKIMTDEEKREAYYKERAVELTNELEHFFEDEHIPVISAVCINWLAMSMRLLHKEKEFRKELLEVAIRDLRNLFGELEQVPEGKLKKLKELLGKNR
jgi:hypothetical protein